ncbi:ABC transporter permease subunit [Dactylosporangium sp. AC04546]|uniref:ABC transporter permease subunit n=1 Tax=Dactylosporangium sp. AC04546 TaxID=2862460 RepID=UPI001EDE4304|nr:ABC transporter permease subunit [Dactylosporangium sp. AC04546]WVK79461.1 ABC transporter permease subunit [Dactylosporangium sp. AC04546]
MIWLTWRQFRAQAWAATGCLAVLAAALAVTGPRLAHLYATSGLGTCAADGDCAAAQRAFAGGVKADDVYPLVFFAGIAILHLMPAVIGMFWGAPLVAREVEAHTFRLAWTQGVSRIRWLCVKLALVGGTAALVTALLSWAITWWSAPIDRADGLPGADVGLGLPNRLMPVLFGARDLAPVGYAVFACTLGAAAGALIRRTVPAMAVTLAVVAATQLIVPTMVREHYHSPATTTVPLTLGPGTPQQITIDGRTMTVSTPVSIPGGWITSVRTVDPAGRPFTGPAPQACLDPSSSPAACDDAINQLRLRQLVTYQPGSRYWRFQLYETAACVLLALVLAGLLVRYISRLHPA